MALLYVTVYSEPYSDILFIVLSELFNFLEIFLKLEFFLDCQVTLVHSVPLN
jgi:hypothetical protein